MPENQGFFDSGPHSGLRHFRAWSWVRVPPGALNEVQISEAVVLTPGWSGTWSW